MADGRLRPANLGKPKELKTILQRFWLQMGQPVAAENVAVLRICVACLALWAFLRGLAVPEWLGQHGPRGDSNLILPFSLDVFLNASPTMVQVLLQMGVMSSLMLMVGLLTPLAAVTTGILLLSLRNHLAWASSDGGMQVAACLMLALVWLPSGAAWSVDRRLGLSRARPQGLSAWPIRYLQMLQCIIYLESGLYKLMGSEWVLGNALTLSSLNFNFSRIAAWVPENSAIFSLFATLSTWLVLFWEVTFPLWMLHPISRRASIAMGVVMHLVLWTCFSIGLYPAAMLVLYLTYLPNLKSLQGAPCKLSLILKGWLILHVCATLWAVLPKGTLYDVEPGRSSGWSALGTAERLLVETRTKLLSVFPPANWLQAYVEAFGLAHSYNTFAPNPSLVSRFFRVLDSRGSLIWSDFPTSSPKGYSWISLTLRGLVANNSPALPAALRPFLLRVPADLKPEVVLEEWIVLHGYRGDPETQLQKHNEWTIRRARATPGGP